MTTVAAVSPPRDRPNVPVLLMDMNNHRPAPGARSMRTRNRLAAFRQAHPVAADSDLGIDDLLIGCASASSAVLKGDMTTMTATPTVLTKPTHWRHRATFSAKPTSWPADTELDIAPPDQTNRLSVHIHEVASCTVKPVGGSTDPRPVIAALNAAGVKTEVQATWDWALTIEILDAVHATEVLCDAGYAAVCTCTLPD